MSLPAVLFPATISLCGAVIAAETGGPPPMDSRSLKALFVDPPREYSTAPLWVWNDELSDDMVLRTLRDLAGQYVRQVFIHPRPGLMTPYLSDEWLRLWQAALDEARRLDMNVWIYDENSYPSGFAGGLVPEAMPEARGRGLAVRELNAAPRPGPETLAVFRLAGDRYEDVTAALREGQAPVADRYLVFSMQRAGDSPWYGGKCYVDLLYPGVTEKFIEVTLEAYRRAFGDEFGQRVPGVFTDEPHLRPAGGLPWTDDLPAVFERRWGYRLTERLPELVRPVGDWKRTRHNYQAVLLELFIERWARPIYDYCERHGLEFTGHYWEHEWTRHYFGPDNMAMYTWQQRPAIDTLFNQYGEDVHAQFGNVRAVKELSSVANQLGRPRTLCEAYGAAGWDIRFEDLKRIGDWLYVLGVNTLDQHLSYVSIRGARKRDHPGSFSYHAPWWPAYHLPATYFARLSAALSAGQEINRVLVLEPTTTLWLYTTEEPIDPRWVEVAGAFQRLVTELARQQVEFDLGSEDVLARYGSVAEGTLRVGRRAYDIVVLPPLIENLNTPTVDLLARFLAEDGTVLCCGTPTLVDGSPSQRLKRLAGAAGWERVEPGALAAELLKRAEPGLAVSRAPDDRGLLFHQRRRLDDGELLFLVNTSSDAPSAGTITAAARGAERWDPASGQTGPWPFETTGDGVRLAFELPPCGSLLLFLSQAPLPAAPRGTARSTVIEPVGPPTVRRSAPNVLVLDYVDVAAGGQTRTRTYVYQANQFVFAQHGLERNPWDGAVQFRDELIARKFAPDSGFEATYRFTIEDAVPPTLLAVVERGDLYTITCNDRPVAPFPDQWWLDRQFSRINIAAAARVGENRLTIRAAPFTMYHELEAAYVLGDFRLRPGDSGYVIVPDSGLTLGPWNEQGHPFYGDGVAYAERFELPDRPDRCVVALRGWYGSVAEVRVNGKAAGWIYCRPWELDVTDLLAPGINAVEVVVVGTLRNTLGPHHCDPAPGIAWPTMFQVGPSPGPPPGRDYSTVGYGLFEPFVLKREVP